MLVFLIIPAGIGLAYKRRRKNTMISLEKANVWLDKDMDKIKKWRPSAMINKILLFTTTTKIINRIILGTNAVLASVKYSFRERLESCYIDSAEY